MCLFNRFINIKIFKSQEFTAEVRIEKIKKLYVPFYQFRTEDNTHALIEFVSSGKSNEYYFYKNIAE